MFIVDPSCYKTPETKEERTKRLFSDGVVKGVDCCIKCKYSMWSTTSGVCEALYVDVAYYDCCRYFEREEDN